jgi:hypothetical protein
MFIVCSFVRPIVHGSFICSSDRSIVRPSVRPYKLCSAVMLPKFRSFVRPIIRSFVRSFIIPIRRSRSFIRTIHRSSFVHNPYSSFIVRSYELFTVHRIIHSHYSSFIGSFILLFIVTIHRSFDRPNIQLLIHHDDQLT